MRNRYEIEPLERNITLNPKQEKTVAFVTESGESIRLPLSIDLSNADPSIIDQLWLAQNKASELEQFIAILDRITPIDLEQLNRVEYDETKERRYRIPGLTLETFIGYAVTFAGSKWDAKKFEALLRNMLNKLKGEIPMETKPGPAIKFMLDQFLGGYVYYLWADVLSRKSEELGESQPGFNFWTFLILALTKKGLITEEITEEHEISFIDYGQARALAQSVNLDEVKPKEDDPILSRFIGLTVL